jgi:putative ATPase
VEDGTITLIGATTENPYFSLVTPLLSRCILLRLEPLPDEDLRSLMDRALADRERGLGEHDVKVTDEALDHLVQVAGGDARIALTGLEASVLAAVAGERAEVDLPLAEASVQQKAVVTPTTTSSRRS